MRKFWMKTPLWKRVTAGLVLGIVAGLILGPKAEVFGLFGEIFIRLVKMIMVPLIYVSIVIAITSIEDMKVLTRIIAKSLSIFLTTTCFAICIGIGVAYVLKPGVGIDLQYLKPGDFAVDAIGKKTMSVAGVIRDLIPDNALQALVTAHLLQVIFFAFFTGFTINLLNKEKSKIVKGFALGRSIVFKMIDLILELAPLGAFGCTAALIGAHGIGILSGMAMLLASFFLAIALQYLMFGVFIALAGLSPKAFYKKSFEYQLLALSTSSSKATLPTTMRVCSEKLGISKGSTSFVLPLGAAINMDGMAIYLGICALFFAQAYGVQLSGMDYVLIVLASTLGSIGGAGVPSGSIVMMPMVLSAVNIPLEGIAFIVGIDRILDMFRTTLNITGDAAVTLIVDKSEGSLDEEVYYKS